MLNKTKMCKFHILGKCAKGPQCPFAHDKVELRDAPDLRRTKICKTLLQTGECKDKSCTFAHNKNELRTTGIFQKSKDTTSTFPSHDCFDFAKLQSDMLMDSYFLPPGLEFDQCFDNSDNASWGSSTTVGEATCDVESSPSSGSELGEPAYVNLGMTMGPNYLPEIEEPFDISWGERKQSDSPIMQAGPFWHNYSNYDYMNSLLCRNPTNADRRILQEKGMTQAADMGIAKQLID